MSDSATIIVRLPTVLAGLAGGASTIEVEGRTLGDVVSELSRRFPDLGPRLQDEDGEPYPYVTFYLNDEDIRLKDGFGTGITEGDELTVVPAIAGGATDA